MKTNYRLQIITSILLSCAAFVSAQQTVSIPIVDLTGNYPEKKLHINEIADIEYVVLETTDNSLIKNINGIAMNDDRIVITDKRQDRIFIFDRKGNFINCIARKGGSPEDYQKIELSCVDFNTGRIYIWDYMLLNRIKVYDFSGKYIRQINVGKGPWPDQIYIMDDSHLIAHYDSENLSGMSIGNTPYRVINTVTGKTTPLNLRVEKPLSNQLAEYASDRSIASLTHIPFYPLQRTGGKIVVSDFALPLIYEINEGKLIPLAKRMGTGELGNRRNRISAVQAITDRYLLLRTIDTHINSNSKLETSSDQSICYDRINKSISAVDLYNDDMQCSMQMESWNNDLPANTTVDVIPIFVLDKRHEQGKLSEQMERFYSSLDSDSNDILVITRFH